MQYGMPLSDIAIELFGKQSYNDDFSLNTVHIASLMYQNEELKNKLNENQLKIVIRSIEIFILHCILMLEEETVLKFILRIIMNLLRL